MAGYLPPPQAIQAVQLGNYDLMLLVECLGYDVV